MENKSDLEKYKIKELKELCRSNNIKLTGKKQELIDRLCKFLELKTEIKSEIKLKSEKSENILKNENILIVIQNLNKWDTESEFIFSSEAEKKFNTFLVKFLKWVLKNTNMTKSKKEIKKFLLQHLDSEDVAYFFSDGNKNEKYKKYIIDLGFEYCLNSFLSGIISFLIETVQTKETVVFQMDNKQNVINKCVLTLQDIEKNISEDPLLSKLNQLTNTY